MAMSRDEAMEFLGLDKGKPFTEEELTQAYRVKAKATHSDSNTDLNSNSDFHKTTEARNLLLAELTNGQEGELPQLTKDAMAYVRNLNAEVIRGLLDAKQTNAIKYNQYLEQCNRVGYMVNKSVFDFVSEHPADYAQSIVLTQLQAQVMDERRKIASYDDTLRCWQAVELQLNALGPSLYITSLLTTGDDNYKQIQAMRSASEKTILILSEAIRIVSEFCAKFQAQQAVLPNRTAAQ